MRYDAFISYRHSTDSALAHALRTTLHALGRRWYRRRALDVYLDTARLHANEDAWGSIRQALEGSRFLILLASPGSAASPWVTREVRWWAEKHGSMRNVIVALADGTVAWNASGVDPQATTALAPELHAYFTSEPLWADLTSFAAGAILESPRLRGEALKIAARVHGVAPEDLLSQELSEYRRRVRALRMVAVVISVLLVSALAAWRAAVVAGNNAVSRAFAAAAFAQRETDPERGVLLAQRALAWAPTGEASAALRELLAASRVEHRIKQRWPVRSAAFDATAGRVLTVSGREASVWDARRHVRIGTVLRHDGEVSAAAFYGADGGIITAETRNEGHRIQPELRLWSADGSTWTSRRLALPHPNTVVAIDSPAPGRVVTTSADGFVRVWDLATATLVRSIAAAGADDLILAAAFDPAGTQLLVAASSGLYLQRLFDSGSPRRLSPDGHAAAVAFGPTGTLALVARGYWVELWDVRSGTRLQSFGHRNAVRSAAMSPDEQYVVVGTDDGAVWIWEIATGRRVAELLGHSAPVNSVRYSSDGLRVLTASDDGTAREWTARADDTVLRIDHPRPVGSIAFSADAERIVTADDGGMARVSDLRMHAITDVPADDVDRGSFVGAAFAREQRSIVTVWATGSARAWTRAPAGEWKKGPLLVHDVPSLALEDWPLVRRVAFDPDGGRMLTVRADVVRVWDVASASGVGPAIVADDPPVIAATFIDAGTRVVTAGPHGLRVWDVATGAAVGAPMIEPGPVERVAFGCGGSTALTTSGRAARVWSTARRESGPSWSATEDLLPVAVACDGVHAAVATPTSVRVWDGRTAGGEIALDHARVWRGAFSPDGRLLATATTHGSVRVWAAATGALVETLSPDDAGSEDDHAIRSVAFAPDGRHLAVAGNDRTVRVYPFEKYAFLADLLAELPRRVTRGLKPDERRMYEPVPRSWTGWWTSSHD